jgi:hypothetical protein
LAVEKMSSEAVLREKLEIEKKINDLETLK